MFEKEIEKTKILSEMKYLLGDINNGLYLKQHQHHALVSLIWLIGSKLFKIIPVL